MGWRPSLSSAHRTHPLSVEKNRIWLPGGFRQAGKSDRKAETGFVEESKVHLVAFLPFADKKVLKLFHVPLVVRFRGSLFTTVEPESEWLTHFGILASLLGGANPGIENELNDIKFGVCVLAIPHENVVVGSYGFDEIFVPVGFCSMVLAF